MKKLFCLLLSAVMLLSLCSCTQFSAAPMKWSEKTQYVIKRDYAKLWNEDSFGKVSADDVIIEDYYGIYQDNAVALFITSTNEGYYCPIIEEDIANCHFTFGSTQPLYIYHKGQFTPIGEAYENGIISKEDVAEIHKVYSLGIDKELYDRIRQDYAKNSSEDIKAEEVEFECYGKYPNNAVAILILSADSFAKKVEEDIANIHFTFSSTEPIRIYKDGVFTPLKEAYEEGIVSKEDVLSIHERYERSEHYERCFGE